MTWTDGVSGMTMSSAEIVTAGQAMSGGVSSGAVSRAASAGSVTVNEVPETLVVHFKLR